MLNGIVNTEAKIQSTESHSIEKTPCKFSKNYKSTIFQKPLSMVNLSKQVKFVLNQCHSKTDQSGRQTMGQSPGKPEFLYDSIKFNKN